MGTDFAKAILNNYDPETGETITETELKAWEIRRDERDLEIAPEDGIYISVTDGSGITVTAEELALMGYVKA